MIETHGESQGNPSQQHDTVIYIYKYIYIYIYIHGGAAFSLFDIFDSIQQTLRFYIRMSCKTSGLNKFKKAQYFFYAVLASAGFTPAETNSEMINEWLVIHTYKKSWRKNKLEGNCICSFTVSFLESDFSWGFWKWLLLKYMGESGAILNSFLPDVKLLSGSIERINDKIAKNVVSILFNHPPPTHR